MERRVGGEIRRERVEGAVTSPERGSVGLWTQYVFIGLW